MPALRPSSRPVVTTEFSTLRALAQHYGRPIPALHDKKFTCWQFLQGAPTRVAARPGTESEFAGRQKEPRRGGCARSSRGATTLELPRPTDEGSVRRRWRCQAASNARDARRGRPVRKHRLGALALEQAAGAAFRKRRLGRTAVAGLAVTSIGRSAARAADPLLAARRLSAPAACWSARDLEAVAAEAAARIFEPPVAEEMPADNRFVAFLRGQGPPGAAALRRLSRSSRLGRTRRSRSRPKTPR
jgi:hypothetical protein